MTQYPAANPQNPRPPVVLQPLNPLRHPTLTLEHGEGWFIYTAATAYHISYVTSSGPYMYLTNSLYQIPSDLSESIMVRYRVIVER